MSERKYPCPMNPEGCEYGGNKCFNYGFLSGVESYCKKAKRWVQHLDICPLQAKKGARYE